MHTDRDTIAAIATPVGQAGIGIVRLSGPLAEEIARNIFRPRPPLSALQSHRLYLGRIQDPADGTLVDEVLLTLMAAPRSYTREDVVEIHSHSGYRLLSRILEIVLTQGARLARPGEFTFRAFINGRIDLSQAEAVMDLIHAKSDRGIHLAAHCLAGGLKHRIEGLRQQIVELLALVEAALDFPDEEDVVCPRGRMDAALRSRILPLLRELIQAGEEKRIWVEGVNTVIAGRVNVGKSSLLNRLAHEERAIVTPVPGTTRDLIETPILIRGLPLNLVDTAGLRPTADEVERIGVRRTEQRLASADLILCLIDQSQPLTHEDMEILARCQGRRAVLVLNKQDLPGGLSSQDLDRLRGTPAPAVRISALTGEGLEALKETIFSTVTEDDTLTLTPPQAVPNLRQSRALVEAAGTLEAAAQTARSGAPMEIVALELRGALDALGEILGETTPDEVLESIFSRFCIGK